MNKDWISAAYSPEGFICDKIYKHIFLFQWYGWYLGVLCLGKYGSNFVICAFYTFYLFLETLYLRVYLCDCVQVLHMIVFHQCDMINYFWLCGHRFITICIEICRDTCPADKRVCIPFSVYRRVCVRVCVHAPTAEQLSWKHGSWQAPMPGPLSQLLHPAPLFSWVTELITSPHHRMYTVPRTHCSF